ncbi:MAG: hypothetical protein JO297_18405 [Nitrososphaeraceae archaeon]|nr:hypothetical protein [Nitrososphaeraceae archaeon]
MKFSKEEKHDGSVNACLEGKCDRCMKNNNDDFPHNIHCEVEDGFDFISSHFQESQYSQGKL